MDKTGKPYRLMHGLDQQGLELDYRDIIKMQMQIDPQNADDVTANGNVSTTNIYNTTVTGGALSSNTPQPLGVAAAGSDTEGSHSDHVHDMPKLDDVDAPDDNTDLNASTTAHGLLKKLDNNAAHFLDGQGAWTTPPSTSMTGGYGDGIYGDGADGDVTLGSNTTLASSTYVYMYNNLDLAGFTLTAADVPTIIFVKGTLTLGGGVIRGVQSVTGGTGGAGATASNGTGGGAGGNGGLGAGFIMVLARLTSGSGTIQSNGGGGVTGSNGTYGGDPGSSAGGTTGNGGSNAATLRGFALSSGAAGGGAGGGTGGTGGIAMSTLQKRNVELILNWLHQSDYLNGSNDRLWYTLSRSGGGGTGGSRLRGAQPDAPAAGGGGAGFYTAGGDGGTNNATSTDGVDGDGTGGGGGGGGAGCAVIVITDSAPSGLVVSANGGTGGNGGLSGKSNNNFKGTGGGGGSGGLAVLVAQSGNTATVTATKGSGGTGNTSGTAPATNGRVFNLTR